MGRLRLKSSGFGRNVFIRLVTAYRLVAFLEGLGAVDFRPGRQKDLVWRPFGDKYHGDFGNTLHLHFQQNETVDAGGYSAKQYRGHNSALTRHV